MKNNKKKRQQKQSFASIEKNRDGGSIAIRGFNFQFLYACYQMLQELSDKNDNTIRLEGIEDIDILHKNEFIQVKSSINPISASIFWNMNVLKNYLEVYKHNTDFNFRFVHNTTISNGNLKGFEKRNLNKQTLQYWIEKIKTLDNNETINIQDFLQRIIFEKVNITTLITECKRLLLEKFDLNSGTEEQFLIALLYNISKWSEYRKTINYSDILSVIQFVKDSSSKNSTNQAIKQNLITEVLYDKNDNTTDFGYFDGKSAKPIHIALGLPVTRKIWQLQIKESLNKYDITVIKSSSGQGKSTLAWQVAYDLQKDGFTIYQLNYCKCSNDIEGLFDFIETRVKIGLVPLIVIDGLNLRVEEWDKLAERLFSLPIKIIVTTREEDWYRYGLDISKVQLNIIDINLLQEEAKSIFIQLNKKSKIDCSIKSWQPSWEKIKAKGLLIEYIYLLTHGSMIQERLEQQIKQLHEDKDASAKIEILRIITLSDILNIKIKTKQLTIYVQNNIKFQSDRGELYSVLEKEYYLQLNKKYVEGLHPVRSQHLVDILHQKLSIEESLINLLTLIDDESIYDYFATASLLIDNNDKEEFLKLSAEIISKKSFNDMVHAIDGLMHFEPYSYWLINREIYDDVYHNGLIKLFVNFNPPFIELNTLEEMNKTFKTDTSEYVLKKKKNLSKFSFENTFVTIFCLSLSKNLFNYNMNVYSNYNGLGYLIKWFTKIKTIIPDFIDFEEEFLISELKSKELEDVSNLYIYCQIVYKEEYVNFLNKNKELLFSILKQKTDSLIIQERDNELDIKYLATTENMNNLNGNSMKRIDILKDIFPYYDKYNTTVYYLPFPNEELYKHSIQEAYKTIPKENLFDKFDIHLNVIWRKTIIKQYSYETVYEWQEYYKNLRVKFLEFMKACNRLFEYKLEGKSIKSIFPLYQDIFALLKLEKEFPTKTIKYDIQEVFKEQQQNINNYKLSYQNFLNQLSGLIDNSDVHLPLMNLKDAYLGLLPMQKAFDSIQNDTYQYFDMEDIKNEEILWLDRLLNTITFFINHQDKVILFAKEKISIWHEKKKSEELKLIHTIIKNLEINLEYNIYYPKKVLEQKYREVSIGLENFNEHDLDEILFALVDFKNLDIDFINIFKIYNKKANIGFRIPRIFFEEIQLILDDCEYEESEFGKPHLINITDELLETLNNRITIESVTKNIAQTVFIEIMYDVWKLLEYRNQLNKNSAIENKWLEELKIEISKNIIERINLIDSDEKDFILEIINENISISKNEIVIYMNKRIGVQE